MRSLLLFACCAALVLGLHADDTTIWIEGESAAHTDMKPHNWYAGAVNKSLL